MYMMMLCKYILDGNLTSFQRQLNLYGFRRTRDPDKGYMHPHFVEGQRQLCSMIRRVPATTAAASNAMAVEALMARAEGLMASSTPAATAAASSSSSSASSSTEPSLKPMQMRTNDHTASASSTPNGTAVTPSTASASASAAAAVSPAVSTRSRSTRAATAAAAAAAAKMNNNSNNNNSITSDSSISISGSPEKRRRDARDYDFVATLLQMHKGAEQPTAAAGAVTSDDDGSVVFHDAVAWEDC